ncbi:hypothetical protein DdX_17828 [Ditylenchus destructor]|uniref:Gustatory receptor n=1 Tax=Ditylenchus destructor TaxID=166010 RepID=A0AAD4QYN4_9BILA|nr:hypothetical protein DdX_17828 [Ditylenchus destructor]
MYSFRRRSTIHRPSPRHPSQLISGRIRKEQKNCASTNPQTSPEGCYESTQNDDSETPFGNGLSPNSPQTNVKPNGETCRRNSALGDLVDISMKNCRVANDDFERGFTPCMYPISGALNPVAVFLRMFGYFPQYLHRSRMGISTSKNRRFLPKRIVILFWTAAIFILNLYFFRYNLQILIKYNEKFGVMHSTTVSAAITTTKPFVNFCLIAVFLIKASAHIKMLTRFDSVDRAFWSVFAQTPNIRILSIKFFIGIFIVFCIPLTYRIFESLKLTETQPRSVLEWLTDYSFVLVPLFSVWNLLPLLYYVLCNRLVCFWARLLEQSMLAEHKHRKYSLKFYYQQFLRITEAQKAIGGLFNPFVLFSLSWSLTILCLTIYFITQPTSSLSQPITESQIRSETFRRMLTERVRLNLGWSFLQIIVALTHICVICATGTVTNEQTRNILTAVLTIIPDTNAELDRFQISCFVHKMSTQYMWGMTVWRAFPLERTTLFTVVSAIITYSFLLLKLKDNTYSIQSPIMLSNPTWMQLVKNYTEMQLNASAVSV